MRYPVELDATTCNQYGETQPINMTLEPSTNAILQMISRTFNVRCTGSKCSHFKSFVKYSPMCKFAKEGRSKTLKIKLLIYLLKMRIYNCWMKILIQHLNIKKGPVSLMMMNILKSRRK